MASSVTSSKENAAPGHTELENASQRTATAKKVVQKPATAASKPAKARGKKPAPSGARQTDIRDHFPVRVSTRQREAVAGAVSKQTLEQVHDLLRRQSEPGLEQVRCIFFIPAFLSFFFFF